MAGVTAVGAELLTGTVMVDGIEVAAEYTRIGETSVSLGSGKNACIPHYTQGFLTIPGEVTIDGTTYTVTEVGDMALRLCNGLTGVNIKENIKRIGRFAFVGCEKMTEIILPASLESIESGAFVNTVTRHLNASVTCLGATPPRWEYNDVFVFHENGIGDTQPKIISPNIKLFVPNDDVYKVANYTNPDIGWTTADGWGSFAYVQAGQNNFHISTPNDLETLRSIVNSNLMYGLVNEVYLDADIDMTGHIWDCGLGISELTPFSAGFHGNGHTISNLRIESNNYGGFIAHYGVNKEVEDITFRNCTFISGQTAKNNYPNGAFGCVIGEGGAFWMENVCLDNCIIESAFDTNGFLVGRCLTGGGAQFINCVIKNIGFCITGVNNISGDLVGECCGGEAQNCALFNNVDLNGSLYVPLPNPFVGKCKENDFTVKNSYNTRDNFGSNSYGGHYDPDTFVPGENVVYDHVVLYKDRSIDYTDADGNPSSKRFYRGDDEAYFKSIFIIYELGLQNWSYQEGDFPMPSKMEHLLPPPSVNKPCYRPIEMLDYPRVNGLCLNEAMSKSDWLDLSPNGYRGKTFAASSLWIDDNFDGSTSSLPIGTATIHATDGVRYDRTLEVTPTGETRPYQEALVQVDEEGNPVTDENGNFIPTGETKTLYETPIYSPTAYMVYLPYQLTNNTCRVFEPAEVTTQDNVAELVIREKDDRTICPWTPYYMVVNDVPFNLGTDNEVTITPRPNSDYVTFGTNDEYEMHGTPSLQDASAMQGRFVLSSLDEFMPADGTMLAWQCYLTMPDGLSKMEVMLEPTLLDNEDNDMVIEDFDGTRVKAVLKGRTFYKDNTWNLLCLPFDLETLDNTPLEGATICTIESSTLDDTDGTLMLNFTNISSIEAGKSYLVKWSEGVNVVNPAFKGVTLKADVPCEMKAGKVSMTGFYSPMSVPKDAKILYVGDDNKLCLAENFMTINSFRACFYLNRSVTLPQCEVQIADNGQSFAINTIETEQGTITSDLASARPGDKVTLTVIGDNGYMPTSISVVAGYPVVTSSGGDVVHASQTEGTTAGIWYQQQEIEVTKIDVNTYEFTLPEQFNDLFTPNYLDITEFRVNGTYECVSPSVLWCDENGTLYFTYDEHPTQALQVGDQWNGETINQMWTGSDVTNTGTNKPGWQDSYYYKRINNLIIEPSFANVRPTSCYMWFYNYHRLGDIVGLEYLNTSNVTNMSRMFIDCDKLTSIDVTNFDTHLVTDMSYMFNDVSNLKSLDITNFDLSNVTNTQDMFSHCSRLETIYCNDDWSKIECPSNDMFVYSNKLKGAVSYDENLNNDISMANPKTGYFTSRTTLANDEENSRLLKERKDYYGDVTLQGRTLWKNDTWNTLCLPFAINDFSGTELDGATVKTLTSTAFNYSTGTLTLNFTDATTIEAGKPYIVKWEATTPDHIENPVFKGMTITSTEPIDATCDDVTFHGIYNAYSTGGADNTMLYLGADNKLYYPNADMTIGAFRAYFILNDLIAGAPANSINNFVLNFGEEKTGVREVTEVNGVKEVIDNSWFSIDGRRLNGKPSRAGLYINNGKKIIVK